MERLKVLYASLDRSNRICKNWTSLYKELDKHCDVEYLTMSRRGLLQGQFTRQVANGSIKPKNLIYQHLQDHTYDIILVEAPLAFRNEPWTKIKIPKICFVEELHFDSYYGFPFKHFDLILHTYNNKTLPDGWHNAMDDIRHCNHAHFPHWVDTDLFDYYGKKNIRVSMTGFRLQRIYPYRHDFFIQMRKKKYFKKFDRPPETPELLKSAYPVGKDYIDILSRSKFSIVGSSIFDYPVQKYFEIAACYCVPISNPSKEAMKLGFTPGHNILYTNNVVDSIKQIGKKRWKMIAKQAYNTVREKHDVKIRVRELLEHMNKTIKEHGPKKPRQPKRGIIKR